MIGRIVGIVFAVLGALMVAATGVAVWLHFYAAQGNLTLWLTSAVPFAIVPAVAAVVVFVVLRRWFMLGLAVIVTVALMYTQAPLWVGESAPAGEPLTVVSSNLYFGRADIDELARIVVDEDTDILSLQEVTPAALTAIESSAIARELPYVHAVTGDSAQGTAIFSRTPLRGESRIEGTLFGNLGADSDLPGSPGTRILALHPAAPVPDAGHWIRDMDTLGAYLHALPPGPVIAAGDFNATWDQVRYRDLLTDGLVDAADQSGAGFLPTYPTDRLGGNRPVIAIDHVIARGFVATSNRTMYLQGSDHRVLVVSLVPS